MFSTIQRSSAAFLFPYNAFVESASSLQVDQQLQTELEQAVEQGMVSTRSQDSTPAGGASQPSKPPYPHVVVREIRRKADNEGDYSPAQAATKRRRRSAESNGDAAPPSGAGKPGRPHRRAPAESRDVDAIRATDRIESDQKSPTQGSRPNPPQTPKTTTKQATDDGKEDNAIQVAIKKPIDTLNLCSEVLDGHDQVKLDAEGVRRSRKSKIPKKRTKDSEGVAGVDGDGGGIRSLRKNPESSFATNAKATHKRFGSEDIEVLGTVPSTGVEELRGSQEDISEDGSESEDEAPETVTASAGFDKARTSALDAAKVVARQEEDKKLRRREHDLRLRLQAEAAKDSRSKDKPSSKVWGTKGSLPEAIKEDGQTSIEKPKSLGEVPQTINAGGQIPQAKAKSSGKAPLPLLLPEEILAVEPVVHTPIPIMISNNKLAISQKRKFPDLEPKPPKDIKQGNVRVRVLQDNWSILPPKSSQASKAIRESWLTGRRGFKGELAVPRRKPSSSFVRKK